MYRICSEFVDSTILLALQKWWLDVGWDALLMLHEEGEQSPFERERRQQEWGISGPVTD